MQKQSFQEMTNNEIRMTKEKEAINKGEKQCLKIVSDFGFRHSGLFLSFGFKEFVIVLLFFLLLPGAGRAEWNPWHPDPIIEYHYSYDNVGNITAIEDSVKNSTGTFTYDEVNRLTQAIGNYGVNGAPETVNYSYNAVGDIAGTPNLPTDGNGNITQIEGKTIYYDYENRPYKITDSTGTITEFKQQFSVKRI